VRESLELYSEKIMEDSNGNGVKNGIAGEKILETPEEKQARTKSLIIVYFTLFLQSLGLAISMTGVWPFLDKVSCFDENLYELLIVVNGKVCHVNGDFIGGLKNNFMKYLID
jgi:hypothetical protein